MTSTRPFMAFERLSMLWTASATVVVVVIALMETMRVVGASDRQKGGYLGRAEPEVDRSEIRGTCRAFEQVCRVVSGGAAVGAVVR